MSERSRKKQRLIRCRHRLKSGRLCNVPLCRMEGGKITVRKKGREVSFFVSPRQTVVIRCERCGSETIIQANVDKKTAGDIP